MAGFGLLARSTYLHEAQIAQDHVRDMARSISFVIDSELDKRVAIARTLGASRALRDGDIERFYGEAKTATAGTGDTMILVDAVNQVANTKLPFGTPLPARGWHTDPPLISGEPQVTNLLVSRISGKPVLTVMV